MTHSWSVEELSMECLRVSITQPLMRMPRRPPAAKSSAPAAFKSFSWTSNSIITFTFELGIEYGPFRSGPLNLTDTVATPGFMGRADFSKLTKFGPRPFSFCTLEKLTYSIFSLKFGSVFITSNMGSENLFSCLLRSNTIMLGAIILMFSHCS